MALLLDGAVLRSMHLDHGLEPVVRREEVRFLFGDARDLQVLESVTQDEVAVRLEAAAARIDGLQLMLILLDPELTADTRLTAAAETEELLARPGIAEAVESILYAEPLPAGADPAGALDFCSKGAPRAARLVSELVARQALIAEARAAWQQVPPAVFGTPEDREYAQAVFVREGLFRSLVLARETRRHLADLRFDALLNPEVKKLRNHREILRCWLEPIHQEREHRHREEQRVEAADVVAEGDAPPYRRGLDRQKRLADVDSQKAAIVAAMEHGNLARARRYVAELIEFQTSGGQDPTYACMSLCDLAIKAKPLSLPDLQVELSRTATDLKPDDAWSWVQYADALLDTGSLEAALAASENAIAFGKLVAGSSVRAEALRALGRLDEALALYDGVIESSPEDEVARSGRADLLRTLNRLGEALSEYNSIIAEFPDSIVARNGRAEVLRSLNRPAEALAAYDAVIGDFPHDVVARNGRAEVLRSLNRPEEALAAYDEAIGAFPRDVVARNGRAEVLRSLNRPEEALAAYDEVIRAFPHNAVARNGRAEVLRSLNRLEEAVVAYDGAIRAFPRDAVARSGRAEVLRSLNRLEEALVAYDGAIRAFPRDAVARSGRAEVLRSMNRPEEALSAYEEAIDAFPQDVVARNGRAEVLRSLNRLDEALAAYDSAIGRFPHSIVARAGHAEVLRSLGRLGEALGAFDEILREHPHDSWSRVARAALLVSLGRLDEAFASLPDQAPVTEDDWVAYHIRGMILLRRGRLDEAAEIFSAGVPGGVTPEQRDYFRSALALTNLRRGRAPAAAEALDKVETRIVDPIANLLRLHAFCLLSQRDLAVEAEGRLAAVSEPGVQEVRSELRRRFLAGGQPLHSEPWILEQETILLLAAVGTLLSFQRNRSAR
ncbi:MAG TPA: tetratricopeptide repeat protein [Thermoanaerobaculia bacterium]|nr:tetratricopeptide repeat protein [Thermoanaerobaculia bacterium]